MGLPIDFEYDLHSVYPRGEKDLISDVAGVRVGHVSKRGEDICTGVTAIVPGPGNRFRRKLIAGADVINGFGKTAGLVQLEELGTLEAPIMMTNTLSVGTVLAGTVRYMLDQDPDIGKRASTVNCVVTECNDGRLNDIRGMHVTEDDARKAIESAGERFAEGGVGAGSGMMCMGFKGGIGSASRTVRIDGVRYTAGSIVLTNFGAPGSLVIGGRHIGEELQGRRYEKDDGSIILVTATDAPLTARQCKRLANRAPIALGRVGSVMGNGSGDISIAFSTANELPYGAKGEVTLRYLPDDRLDHLFAAAIEAMEESIISALYHAEGDLSLRHRMTKT